ncbi:Endonuclease/exonuclease/phosphatase [Glomus cerebriforme]|uniref:Endonuclease/exonuclease/phosphatase n=1 Tax=Glomus cerebriforme TaxID=658196 RepID=A0A397T2U2_9GLOM|nr:Endonuclease/exonuclease/phosphatase [Glomus cerebriforme]
MTDRVEKPILTQEINITQDIQDILELKSINVFAGTFNVSGQDTTESLSPWLQCDYDIDVYAIGFQELDLSVEAFIVYDNARELKWTDAVLQALGDKAGNYWKIMSKQLVGILLIVLVKKVHAPYIKEIRADSAGIGLMGMMGNKGGVAIRFRFYDSYLCFVNCHLAADPNGLERRNQDYMDLCQRLTFPINTNEYSTLYGWVGDYIPPYAINAVAGMGEMVGITNITGITDMFASNENVVGSGQIMPIFDNDHLIWMGDLNYRIDNIPESEIKSMLENNKMELLLDFDQLNRQRRIKKTFNGFEEGQITFPPTYKYDFGTNIWDTSEKKRSPAWTDRILWRSQRNDWNKQLSYNSHMEITLSDHKPVSAIFQLKLKICAHVEDNMIILKDNGCDETVK